MQLPSMHMHTLEVPIDRFSAEDSIEELTQLLHRSFARLGAMGLNYTAVSQNVDVTARRLTRGECYVARIANVVVGTVIVERPNPSSSCEWYTYPGNASAHQLAVDPSHQGKGIGTRLMAFAERWATERNYSGIAIDTAEPAIHLIDFYACRGYQSVGFTQWEGKSYRSVVMRKSLPGKNIEALSVGTLK